MLIFLPIALRFFLTLRLLYSPPTFPQSSPMKRFALWLFLVCMIFCLPVGAQPLQPQPHSLTWTFPLPRPHTGILLGNGVQGLMVWGDSNTVNITLGRAGFWDRRGGNNFSTKTNYQQVKTLLQTGDEAGLMAAFGRESGSQNQEALRPHQVGGGRLVLTLPKPYRLTTGILSLDNGTITLTAISAGGKPQSILIRQSVMEEYALVELSPKLSPGTSIQLIPSWEFIKKQVAPTGVQPPTTWETAQAGGFVQTLPQDDPLAVVWEKRGNLVLVSSSVHKEAEAIARRTLQSAQPAEMMREADAWWKAYWEEVPGLVLPDPVLQEIYDYGLYKQACVHPPQGLPASLQGPFMEDYQLPPWSNDYHFNINIQMIYWPALMTNRASDFGPLWRMIKGWLPGMQATGESFFQRKGALMMPHAVDDRCQVVGSFWTGTIDHGCAAWMGQMAWLQYRYSLDRSVLDSLAWPLLNGTFEGYWAMLEEVPDGRGGQQFSLPVTVSPEYRGSGMNAWGRDASFQLAALHMTAELLQEAAVVMGKEPDPRWADVRARLPHYATFTGVSNDDFGNRSTRIALWEGQDLVTSHRHHSHLAGIWPFVTFDLQDTAHAKVVQAAINHWTNQGMGGWSGWCIPWAAVLNMRTGPVETGVSRLHFWRENFVNEGRGTLHNANNSISLIGSPIWSKLPAERGYWEVMQLDAGFGALQAVLEIMVQHRRDGIHVLPDIPLGWKSLSFENIRTEGAFQVSARVQEGKTQEITIRSLKGGKIKLWPHLGHNWLVAGVPQSGEVLEKVFQPGEVVVLKRN